jgi:hypothetical protein
MVFGRLLLQGIGVSVTRVAVYFFRYVTKYEK